MTDPARLRRRPRSVARAGRGRARRRLAAVGLAVAGAWTLAVLGFAACSGAPEFDREAAVSRVVDESGGVVDRSEAGCYVDRVIAEVGTAPLADGAEPQPEQIRALTSIKIDCFGVDKIGATTSVSTAPPATVDGVVPQPMAYGDDPGLDALWDQCEAGSGAACDELFDAAPINSDYEEFAGTCGGRTQELTCAPVYTLPTQAPTTTPSTSAPSTTATTTAVGAASSTVPTG